MTNPQNKEYYEKMAATKLEELKAKIDTLKARAEASEAEVRSQYLEQVEKLEKRYAQAKSNVDSLREAGEKSWKEFTSGVDESMATLRQSIDTALMEFKKTRE